MAKHDTYRAFSNVNTNIISNFGLVPFDKITTLVNIMKQKRMDSMVSQETENVFWYINNN